MRKQHAARQPRRAARVQQHGGVAVVHVACARHRIGRSEQLLVARHAATLRARAAVHVHDHERPADPNQRLGQSRAQGGRDERHARFGPGKQLGDDPWREPHVVALAHRPQTGAGEQHLHRHVRVGRDDGGEAPFAHPEPRKGAGKRIDAPVHLPVRELPVTEAQGCLIGIGPRRFVQQRDERRHHSPPT